MAQHTSKAMSSLQMLSGLHWGCWLRQAIRAAGYPNVAAFQRAVGCGRRQIWKWLASVEPLEESHDHRGFYAAMRRRLGVTEQMWAEEWRAVPVALAESDVRAALLADLATDAAYLDTAGLRLLADVAATFAADAIDRKFNDVGGSPAMKHGEGSTANGSRGACEESGQQSRFHPAPAETSARAFLSAGSRDLVGDHSTHGGNPVGRV